MKVRNTFWFWFLICLSPFLMLNLLLVLLFTVEPSSCSITEFGFPSRWYVFDNYHGTGTMIQWNELRNNVVLAVGASLVGGKLLQSHFRQ
jgi:hypothetical protein